MAEGLLKAFDDRLHDLKEYGFTFMTGITVVEGIFLPWSIPATVEPSGMPDKTKFGVLVKTTALLIIVRRKSPRIQLRCVSKSRCN